MILDKPLQKKLWLAGAVAGVSILTYYMLSSRSKASKEIQPDKKPQRKKIMVKRLVSPPKEAEILTAPIVAKVPVKKVPEPIFKKESSVFPLQLGSAGKEVERLQIWLLRNHGWKGEITKVFDEKTKKLVQKGLQQDSVNKATYEKYQMGTPIHQQIPV